jgi:ABC-type transporter Mla maintaining outer membrane lipid asymmetry permease subunit MlaE
MSEIYVIEQDKGQGRRYAKYIFLAILAFVAVYMPFFGGSKLRYQLGEIFELVFNIVGMLCIFGGAILILLGILGLLGRKISIGKIIIGALLLWIGCWMTGIAFNFFGIDFGGSSSTAKGYH